MGNDLEKSCENIKNQDKGTRVVDPRPDKALPIAFLRLFTKQRCNKMDGVELEKGLISENTHKGPGSFCTGVCRRKFLTIK